MKSYAVYQLNCLGCNNNYVGKTEHILCTRTAEHACIDKESAIYNHIDNCSYYGYIQNLFHFNNEPFNKTLFNIHSIQRNTKVLDSAHNWNISLIKEALLIKTVDAKY